MPTVHLTFNATENNPGKRMKQYFKCAGFYTGFILVCFIVAGGGNVLANPSVDIVDIDWKSPIALEHPLVGKIYDSKGELTPDKLGDHLAASRYVLIGEKHDNIDHHQLELRLLQLLLGQKKKSRSGTSGEYCHGNAQ